MESDHICALIPAFNAESSLGEVIDRAKKFIQRVLVVSDGSTDHTAEVARSHGCLIAISPIAARDMPAPRVPPLTNGCTAIVTLERTA
jgi:hypothetical protein